MDRIFEILALLAAPENLTDEQISAFEAELQSLFVEVRGTLDDTDSPLSAEDRVAAIEALQAAANGIGGLRALAGQRIEAANEAQRIEQGRLDEEIRLLAELELSIADDGEDEEEEEDADADADADADDSDAEVEPEAVSVTAGATSAAAAPAAVPAPSNLAELNRRTKGKFKAKPGRFSPRLVIRAAGNNGGTFATRADVDRELRARHRDMAGSGGPDGRVRIATFAAQYPSDRVLPEGRVTDVSEMADEVRSRVNERGGVEALVADGGLCAPVNVWYDLQTIAQARRPLRDGALTHFNATRGGITFDSPMTIADIGAATTPTSGNAIGVISESQDAAGTYNKSHQTITCGTPTTAKVDSVYNILQIGNLVSRTYPERSSQFTDLSVAAYARFSEQRLFAAMRTGSKTVYAPQKLGAYRDWITGVNRTAINYRLRHRMDPTATLDIVAPIWVAMGLLPDDQMKALQSYPEQFDVNAADIEQKLADRHVRVVAWYEDEFTTAQGNGGGINAYPSVFSTIMFHPGAWVYVDNGTLDLGVVRDSTLNADNVMQTFSEEFWTAAMWGVESLDIRFSLCANGASAGSIAPVCGS